MAKFVNDDMDEEYLNSSHQQMLRFGQAKAMNMATLGALKGHQLLSNNNDNDPIDEQKAKAAEMELMPLAQPHTSLAKIQTILAMQSKKMAQMQKQTVLQIGLLQQETELQMGLLQQETHLQISEIVQVLETDDGHALPGNQAETAIDQEL
eukprot:717216_1